MNHTRILRFALLILLIACGAGVAGAHAQPRAQTDRFSIFVPVARSAGGPAPAPGSLPGTAAVPGETTDGLVVVVHDGRVGVSTPETTLEVGKGETAYAPTLGTPPVRMSTPPTDMRVDPFLKAVDFDAISCTL